MYFPSHAWVLAAGCLGLATADLEFVNYDYAWLGADTVNPTLVRISPANGTEDWPPSGTLDITFSEKVLPGSGRITFSSPGETRVILATDPQVSLDATTNLTLVLRLSAALRTDTEYHVEVSPGYARDWSGNNFQGSQFYFRTGGGLTDFATFAPYVQAPDSPVAFAFRTGSQALYAGSADTGSGSFRITIWPSSTDVFYVPDGNSSLSMDGRCARVQEASVGFPALEACRVASGQYKLDLGGPVQQVTEYAFVVRWPVRPGGSLTEVTWHLSISRNYQGSYVDVQTFTPWRHRFASYFANNVDDTQGGLVQLVVQPAWQHGAVDWVGPGTVRDFRFELKFNDAGLLPGSTVRLFSSPMLAWSTNPARPSNITTLQSLVTLDPDLLSDPSRRSTPCLHFFPADFPYNTQCRLLELGLGTTAFGVEVRLPGAGPGIVAFQNVTKAFRLSLPGPIQPLALASHWEAIIVQAASSSGAATTTYGRVTPSLTATVVNVTDGLQFSVLSSSYAYPVPVGTRPGTVELQFSTGTFVLGWGQVMIEILEPITAAFEACVGVPGTPRLGSSGAVMSAATTGEANSAARWPLQPIGGDAGPFNFVAFPGTRYRASCLVYNGPTCNPFSRWRLTVSTTTWAGEVYSFAREFVSSVFYVTVPFSGGQITPTAPVLGRWQAIFVRVVLPVNDSVTLVHWQRPARRLDVTAPPSFVLPEGACRGFRPLTSSAMPPLPVSRCATGPGSQALSVTIGDLDPGFLPGREYAFRVVVQNPGSMDDVQSRMMGGTQYPQGGAWTITLFQDPGDEPVLLLQDVPLSYVTETAAEKPENKPDADGTSFRMYQRSMLIHGISADNLYLGQRASVFFEFTLATTMQQSDALQISAPSGFSWVKVLNLRYPGGLGRGRPFPGMQPQVFADWLIRISVATVVASSVLYNLVVDVINPSTWTAVDREFNFWVLETFYMTLGILDKRSRRDVAVRQGYTIRGPLLNCMAALANRVRMAETLLSVIFQVNEPVLPYVPGQIGSPLRLRLRLPGGFTFAYGTPGGKCNLVMLVDTLMDSPLLPVAQYPHSYSPLPDIGGLRCSLDNARLQRARALTIDMLPNSNAALLPSFLYAFRVRVVNPPYDRIWDTAWTLETVNITGGAVESCSLETAANLVNASGVTLGTLDESGPLPTLRAGVTLKVDATSRFVVWTGEVLLNVTAAPGFVFLHDCLPNVDPPPASGPWALLSCQGTAHSASVRIQVVKPRVDIIITLRPRSPPWATRAVGSYEWSVIVVANKTSYQAPDLVGPEPRELRPLTLQPADAPFFQASPIRQLAVLAFVPTVPVAAGGTIEVVAPRTSSFVFDVATPCTTLMEDPTTLGLQPVTAPTVSTCTQILMSSCAVANAAGTRLVLQVADDLRASVEYCYVVRTVGPAVQAVPPLPISAVIRDAASQTDGGVAPIQDVAPQVSNDGGNGWGVAPFARQAAHLSLCYGSRVASALPKEVVIHLMPTSLGLSQEGRNAVEGRLCIQGASFVAGAGSACKVEEPEGASAAGASCALLTAQRPTGILLCVALTGPVWAPFQRVVISIPVRLAPGVVPRVDLQILDRFGSLMQGDSTQLQYPVLNLLPVALSAPQTASVAVSFPVAITIDWQAASAAFLDVLVQVEQEDPAFVDVATPLGLRLSLDCQPVACRRIVPDVMNPLPGLRLSLNDPAPAVWWRTTRLRRLSKAPQAACGGHSWGRGCPRPRQRRPARSLAAVLAALPAQLHLVGAVVSPLQLADPANVWSVVLRSRSLRALAAVALRGFSVVSQLQAHVDAPSLRAGDVFSKTVIEITVDEPLAIGDLVVLFPPSPDIACGPEVAEPVGLVGPAVQSPAGLDPGACVLGLRQPLLPGVAYALNLRVPNPVYTPNPNVWFVQTFTRSRQSANVSTTLLSVGAAQGFEVAGEFEILELLSKSACPEVFSPVAINFKLRTPLPPVAVANSTGPGPPTLVGRLRLSTPATFNGTAASPTFQPSRCLLDVIRSDVLLDPVPDATLLVPDDCLVSADGSFADFLFYSPRMQAQVQFAMWTWLRNPPLGAAADPSWSYSATTFDAIGRGMHRASLRPVPQLGVVASVAAGSRAANATHRAVVSVTAGRAILGQRGAVQVTLPPGFNATCGPDSFRPRPALPYTARCRAFGSSATAPARVVVFWRTLLVDTDRLRPPFEFSMAVTNAASTVEDRRALWSVELYEGDNQEFLVDGTAPGKVRAFRLCPALDMALRREDATTVTVVFRPRTGMQEGFEKAVRVELRSSARAPATVACPDTSIWMQRPVIAGYLASGALGLPRYTVCVPVKEERSTPDYSLTARQYVSAILFLLPFGPFLADGHLYGLELRLFRGEDAARVAGVAPSFSYPLGTATAKAEALLSTSEAAAELLNVNLLAGGGTAPLECGSAPLGPAPLEVRKLVAAASSGQQGSANANGTNASAANRTATSAAPGAAGSAEAAAASVAAAASG